MQLNYIRPMVQNISSLLMKDDPEEQISKMLS